METQDQAYRVRPYVRLAFDSVPRADEVRKAVERIGDAYGLDPEWVQGLYGAFVEAAASTVYEEAAPLDTPGPLAPLVQVLVSKLQSTEDFARLSHYGRHNAVRTVAVAADLVQIVESLLDQAEEESDSDEGEDDADSGEGEGDDSDEGEDDADSGEGEGDDADSGEGDDADSGEGDDADSGEGDDSGEGGSEGDDSGEGDAAGSKFLRQLTQALARPSAGSPESGGTVEKTVTKALQNMTPAQQQALTTSVAAHADESKAEFLFFAALVGLPGNSSESPFDRISLQRQNDIMRTMSTRLPQDFILSVGSMFKSLSSAYTRCQAFGKHFAGYANTEDIEELLPEDIALLRASPAVRARALADLEAKRLLGNRYENDYESEGGDFVLLVDCSTSMRPVWSMVQPLVAAVYLLGSANGQTVHILYFNGDVYTLQGHDRIDTLERMLRVGPTGGTRTAHALSHVRRRFPDADILLVTDAEDDLQESHVRQVLLGGKITTLFIGEANTSAADVLQNTEGTAYKRIPYVDPDDSELFEHIARALV